ncbi:proton-conducting transporter membrane subunit [Telmatospirillum sp.]|uniref:proton-conducting transporter transmembrane domain-containing protein n=1 Tax=Telmatospirillum sp. TaxID=2079197 RepID=UPI0028464736|nr:proton-conducting transporter membrane subunit [Telmatospirillum sp.]MDR3440683.1 proton-conducting transporter membrane subunit [Telmatospirillum sp.]
MLSSTILAWGGVLLLLAGEVAALASMRNVLRALVISSLAEMGYVLFGFGLGSVAADTGAVMHIAYQVVMRGLLFLALVPLVRAAGGSRLDQMAGIGQTNRAASLMFGFAMFSVMGLSPFKGSFSKFLVLYGAIEQGQWGLAVFGTLASIVSLFVYVTIIQRICFERRPEDEPAGQSSPIGMLWLPLAILTAATIGMSLDPQPLEAWAQRMVGAVGGAGLPDYESPWSMLVLVPYLGGFALYGIGLVSGRLRDLAAIALAAATLVLAWQNGNSDAASWLFAVIFAAVALVVVLYSFAYIRAHENANRYYFFLFLAIGSLLGLATEQQFGNFYVFWELMTWTTYFLVIHEQSEKALKAGRKYFLMCATGAYVMHFGILLLHAQIGSFDMVTIAANVDHLPPGVTTAIVFLFMAGFAVKAGLFPVHGWLPDAHPVAPSSISAPMSGIVTKAGVFGLIKVLFVLFGAGLLSKASPAGSFSSFGLTLSGLGAVTVVYAEIKALRERELKRMLAYSTLAQVGEIIAVLGLGSYLALAGATFHVMNHAAMKSLLFLAAGSFIFRLGRKSIDDFKGVGRAMPLTGLFFAIGALGVMGLPPFSGFFSKFLMIYACVEAGQWPLAAIILTGSVIGAVYYARVLRILFFERYEGAPVAEAPFSMLLATGLLAVVVVLGGLLPGYGVDLVRPVADLAASRGGMLVVDIPNLQMLWPTSAIVAALGAGLAFFVGRYHPVPAGLLSVLAMLGSVAAILAEGAYGETLSFWFALLIAGVGAVNLLHSIGYMRHGHAHGRYYFLFLAMIAGLLGMAASPDLFNFFAFWEIMSSWTLFFLIIHEETPEALREGFKYFLFNFIGASIMFLGIAMLGARSGGFGFDQIRAAAPGMELPWLAGSLVLILLGLAMKAAMLPIRIDYQMHPATAPTPVSGYISSVLLKSGPYGVLKLFAVLGGTVLFSRLGMVMDVSLPFYVLSVVAAITVLYAGAQAMIQTGVKRVLIYATVCQLGYILLGLSLGSAIGVAGGLMHLVNHMLLKDTLFLAAGCILAQAHVVDLDDLGGLGRKMPWTMGMFLFAGLSIAGVPPLNGFTSKWMIFQACLQSGHYLLGLAALMGSLFTLAAILKFAHAAFMGETTRASETMTEAPACMLVAMGVLVASSVAIGFFPGLLLVPIAGIQQSLGLDAVVATWSGPLPGLGGWSNGPLALLLIAPGMVAWLYTRCGGSKVRVGNVHLCGNAFDLKESKMNVNSLYESPDGLIRTVLAAPADKGSARHV